MLGIPLLDSIEAEVKDRFLQHGLTDWKFEFDSAEKRYGYCLYHKKLISLSLTLCILNSRQETTQTILHEIAHALAGAEHGHNRHWLNIARSIGYTGGRCYSGEVLTPAACRRK